MKKFFEDYMDLYKHEWKFSKDRWFGCIIIGLAVGFADLALFGFIHPIDWIKDHLPKKRKNVEDFLEEDEA